MSTLGRPNTLHCPTKVPDSPVYEVKPETGTGPKRVVHRNLLLPCDSLPVDSDLQSRSLNRFHQGGKDSSNVSYVHV